MKLRILSALLALAPLSASAADFLFETFNYSGLDSLAHGKAFTWGMSGTDYNSLMSNLSGANRTLTSASLTLYDPRDWRDEPKDVLYVNILDDIRTGTNSRTYDYNSPTYDSTWGLNAFDDSSGWRNNNLHNAGLQFKDAEAGSLLKSTDADMPADLPGTWTDTKGPYGQNVDLSKVSDVTINFTEANLDLLEQYLRADYADADTLTVGLGFAAECHYYLSKVKLTIVVGDTPIPPPPPPHSVPDTGSTAAILVLAVASLAGLRRRLA